MNGTAKTPEYGLARGIYAIERRHRKFMTFALEKTDVTGTTYSYIITIKRNSGLNQDILAYIHGVDKSRAARVVRDLEKSGYILREFVPDNRRQNMLFLTKAGEDLYELIMEKNVEWEILMSEGIERGCISTTVETINKIMENLDGPSGSAWNFRKKKDSI